jgi:putative DNA primase/helicase
MNDSTRHDGDPSPSIAGVNGAARGHWLHILPILEPRLGQACSRVGHHVPCPFHGGKDGFRLFPDATESGAGICNTCGAFPDGFRLLAWLTTKPLSEVVAAVSALLPEISAAGGNNPAPTVTNAADEERRQQRIMTTLNETIPDPGRIAEYFRSRGLSGNVPRGLRFHPSLRYYDENRQHLGDFPAIVAPVQSLAGDIVTIHRTFLDHHGPGKAPVPSPKKLTKAVRDGATRGAAIRLAEPDDLLALAEGIETALAVMENTGVPAWVTISAGGLESIEVPTMVRRVEIWGDRDRSGAGQNAAWAAARRLR